MPGSFFLWGARVASNGRHQRFHFSPVGTVSGLRQRHPPPRVPLRWIDRKALLFRITDNPPSSPRAHQNGDLGI